VSDKAFRLTCHSLPNYYDVPLIPEGLVRRIQIFSLIGHTLCRNFEPPSGLESAHEELCARSWADL
jgi:hypothetical protein